MRSVFVNHFVQISSVKSLFELVFEAAFPDSASKNVANRRAGFASKDGDCSLIFVIIPVQRR